MFPTIFTLAIKDLGPLHRRRRSGLLIMAIAGGALVVVQGLDRRPLTAYRCRSC
jgi:FHS family L-fucose permease-like MFS transporter